MGTDVALLWNALAIERIRFLADTMDAFSTDDVWSVLDPLPRPADSRALGAVMRQAADARLVRPSDYTTKSQRPCCHARPIAVWVSAARNAPEASAAQYVAERKPQLAVPHTLFSLPDTAAGAVTIPME